MSDREIPPRKYIKDLLRSGGLSKRQVDALLKDGWRGLVGAAKSEAAELRDRLAELQSALQR